MRRGAASAEVCQHLRAYKKGDPAHSYAEHACDIRPHLRAAVFARGVAQERAYVEELQGIQSYAPKRPKRWQTLRQTIPQSRMKRTKPGTNLSAETSVKLHETWKNSGKNLRSSHHPRQRARSKLNKSQQVNQTKCVAKSLAKNAASFLCSRVGQAASDDESFESLESAPSS